MRCSIRKLSLEISQNSQENACAKAYFFNEVAVLWAVTLSKKTLAQVFFCEICEILKNIFFRTSQELQF